jgi:hypothetical protein
MPKVLREVAAQAGNHQPKYATEMRQVIAVHVVDSFKVCGSKFLTQLSFTFWTALFPDITSAGMKLAWTQ